MYWRRRSSYQVTMERASMSRTSYILSSNLADSICQHVAGHSGRVDLVDWYSRSWYECIVYTRGVSIPSEQLQAIILYINKVDLYKTRNLRENVLLLGPMLQKTGSKSKLLEYLISFETITVGWKAGGWKQNYRNGSITRKIKVPLSVIFTQPIIQ